jgi:2-oxoglutarate ferredoxin oxidoreductase subunit beta
VARGFSGDVKGTTELMRLAISHKGFSFLNIISPCVTWRGDDQHKEIRAKVRPLPAEHDKSSREAALRLTNENGIVTTGVLYQVALPTLVDEMLDIRWKAQGDKQPPTRKDILRQFAPATDNS